MSAYLDGWLKDVVKNRVTTKTHESYTLITTLYIKPHIGRVSLQKLTAPQIRAMYNDLISTGLAPQTVRYAHSVLRSALNQAVSDRLIDHNPATIVKPPKQAKKEQTVLTPEQAESFLQAIEGDRWQALFSLLLYTGMRPG